MDDRLLEEKIRRIVKEELRMLLLEMPLPRRRWKQKIDDLLDQIIQNWCLVHYCTLINREALKKHWKEDELQTYLTKCASYKIDGNNSVKGRLKALNEVWAERDFATDVNCINLIVNTKFRKEHIDVNSPIYQQCIEDCSWHTSQIISVIANANVEDIINYTNSI